jgi:hypothetical protein
MLVHRKVVMLAAALAVACTAAPVASAQPPRSGHPSGAISASATPHSLGLPGGTLNGPSDPSGAKRVPTTPRSLGLPGGTLNGPSDPSGTKSVPTTPRSLGLPGGTLNPPAAPRTAVVRHQSSDTMNWVLWIVTVAGLAVIGTALVSRRQRAQKQKSTQTQQTA